MLTAAVEALAEMLKLVVASTIITVPTSDVPVGSRVIVAAEGPKLVTVVYGTPPGVETLGKVPKLTVASTTMIVPTSDDAVGSKVKVVGDDP